MLVKDFDYNLPEELIAQKPSQKREMSKMMVLDKTTKKIEHKHFFDIVDFLTENDVLILNNTKVIPARIFAKKENGTNIEVFLLKQLKNNNWEVLLKPSKRVRPDTELFVENILKLTAIEKGEEGKWIVKADYEGDFYKMLDKIGNIPLPPYIERTMSDDDLKKLDYERYQTVFAKEKGSVAAPTAGLHFTEEILTKLKQKGVKIGYVTLNVGLGTFRPVKCENVLDHKMDREDFFISEETAQLINEAKIEGKNIVAVGTTTVRTLETAFEKYGKIQACKDFSEKFIYPPYEFKVVDRLITNFHLPKSTLIMLVSALAGKEFIFKAYQTAINEKYRFYSYGDCMFIK